MFSKLKKKRFVTLALVPFVALMFSFFSTNILANGMTIVGNWKTVSDVTNKVASVVKIWKYKNEYFGRVVKIYKQGGNLPTDRCTKCGGTYKNKPIQGMTFLFNMKKDSDHFYTGGKILDPKSGSLYKCNITQLSKTKLEVRGYIGFSLLGRTQYWYAAK